MKSAAAFTEKTVCPLCGYETYSVLRDAEYPEGVSTDELLKTYSSSSDHVLMDQLVKCQRCSLAYLNPRVRSEIILKSYSEAVDPTFVQQNQFRISTFRRSLEEICRRHAVTPSVDLRVLDIGCASGAFLKAAKDLGFSTVGVEPSRWMCEFGRREYDLDLRPGTLEEHRFQDREFDIVTLWDVIEHLVDPKKILRESLRTLKPDGLLVINYPDYGSLASRLLGWKWPFLLSVHLTYFTRTTIRRLLQECGFEVLEIRPYWQTLELGYVMQRAAPYFGFFRWIEKVVRAMGLGKFPFTYQVGQSMVVARRAKT